MRTYATQIEMSLADHCWEIVVEVTYHYDAADHAHGSIASVEIQYIIAEDNAQQVTVNQLPQAAINALESEILAGIEGRKVRCQKGSQRRSAP